MDFEDKKGTEDTKNARLTKVHVIRSMKHPEENMLL